MSKARHTPHPMGRLIAVVGPSGAGKDSVIDGLCAQRPDLYRVRRVITRAADAGAEAFDAVSEQAFARLAHSGAFALHWAAHGLSYGIPAEVHGLVAQGRDVVANLSRGVLAEAAVVFKSIVVLHVTAPPDVLLHRVSARGREQGPALQRRLSRPAPQMPKGLQVIDIDNSGPLHSTIATAAAALYPERG